MSNNDLIPCTTDGGPSQLVPMALEGRGGLPWLKMPELYQVSRLNMLDEDDSLKKQTARVAWQLKPTRGRVDNVVTTEAKVYPNPFNPLRLSAGLPYTVGNTTATPLEEAQPWRFFYACLGALHA